MEKAIAIFADGMEESEGLIVVDMLKRAGFQVDIVSIKDDLMVESSHHIKIMCDKTMKEADFDSADLIFLPGGKQGTENIAACEPLAEKIREFDKAGKRLSAVCAAPSVYGRMGLLKGRKATCYPGFESYLKGAEYTGSRVETDGHFTTSKGMGTCIDLAKELISLFMGEEKALAVAKEIMYC